MINERVQGCIADTLTKNIDKLFDEMKSSNCFKILGLQVESLPFWENGVKFFTIEGPNREKVEFCEML